MALAPEKDDSVFDFLYIDSRRIALFLSQFGEYGHLTSLTRSRTASASAGGGIDVKLAKMDGSETESTTLQRQFDTQWVAPLAFLDQANARGMIVRGMASARIGQLVLASGSLEIRDLTIIKRAMALPAMKAQIAANTKIQKPKSQPGHGRDRFIQSPKKEFSPEEFGMQFLAELPHALHATLSEGESKIWSTLKDDCLLVSASDLFLKHGVNIPGDWNVLGILDAFPDSTIPANPEKAQAEFAKAQEAMPQGELAGVLTLVTQGFGGFVDGIAPLARIFLGRQSHAYGMTPLLIFREVSG